MGKEYTRDIQVLGLVPNFGKIIIFDNFSNNLSFIPSGNAGYIVRRNPSIYLSPPASCEIITPPYNEEQASISKLLFPSPANLINSSFIFSITNVAIILNLTFQLYYYDGTYRHIVRIVWVSDGTKWQYLNSAGSLTDIPNATQKLLNNSWNSLNFSFNTALSKHSKFQSNYLNLDISDIPYMLSENTAAPSLELSITASVNSNFTTTLFVDSLKISAN